MSEKKRIILFVFLFCSPVSVLNPIARAQLIDMCIVFDLFGKNLQFQHFLYLYISDVKI